MNIYLPAMTDHENDVLEESVAQTVVAEVKPGKVLVMDDEEAVGQLVVMILATAGYEAVVARDGREALEMYQKYKESGDPVSVVIMDLTIPGGMGGEETIGKLLAIDPDARAIVASGYANDPVMAKYRDYGFVGMLSKPFDMKNIIKAVKEAAAYQKYL